MKTIVEQIADLDPISIEGKEYTGSYLAMLVSLRESPEEEAQRTIQLIAEMGRLHAAAQRSLRNAETEYRIWRDDIVLGMTNDIERAVEAGFSCSVDPGVDSRGKPKPAKLPSIAQTEAFLRGLPEYEDYNKMIAEREEAVATILAVYEAAKQRTWASRIISDYHHDHK